MKKPHFQKIIYLILTSFVLTTSCIQNVTPEISKDSQNEAKISNILVGEYPFEGNANDVSGNLNNGIVQGATLITGHKGDANSAYFFNESANTRIELPKFNTFNITGELTISVWAKTDQTGSGGNTIINTFPDNAYDRFMITINYLGNPQNTNIFDYGNIYTKGRLVSPPKPVAFETWEHYVFTRSKTKNFMKIYKNGILYAGKTGVSNIQNRNKIIVLGGCPANSQHSATFFKGSLDDLKIYNKALTAEDVLTLYNLEK